MTGSPTTRPTVLVTGAAGFLGRHIMAELGPGVGFGPGRRELDLTDFAAVKDYLRAHRPQGIIHAAGFVGGLGLNQDHPGRMATENLRMGLNLLEAAAKETEARVTVVSTVCVYPENAPIPTPEESIYEGYPAPATAFYGLAKRELLSVADGLHQEFGMDYNYLIPTNLYGPGDHFDEERSHVIPAIVKRAHRASVAGDPVLTAWGDGSQTRDFHHVRDCARAIVQANRLSTSHKVMNLSSGIETGMRQLVETIADVVGFTGGIHWDTSKSGGAPRRALDPHRAREVLGFKPEVNLRDGLAETYAWYLANGGNDE